MNARWIAAALVLCMLAVTGCQGSSDEPEPVERQTATKRASAICTGYRGLVTNLHASGGGKEARKEIRALAKGTRTTFNRTGVAELGKDGDEYRATLNKLAPIFARASAAKRSDDPKGYRQALRRARPLDHKVDTLAGRAGMPGCALGRARAGERRTDVRGWPSMVVPAKAADNSPKPSKGSRTYPLSGREALVLSRGPDTRTGISSLGYATFFYRRTSRAASKAKKREKVGRQPVKMQRLAYEGKKLRGTTFLYSGQGYLWVLLCATRNKKPSGKLNSACTRARKSTGFYVP